MSGATASRWRANQSPSGQAVDRAGNIADGSVGGINIDFTPPAIAGSGLPLANLHGWNNVTGDVHSVSSPLAPHLDITPASHARASRSPGTT